jgi:hypothetical protein
MTSRCYRPTLILEGPGDKAAVPALIRAICYDHEIFDLHPAARAIIGQNIPKLERPGELERFVSYAMGHDCDSAFVVLDTDARCAREVVGPWVDRLNAMQFKRRVGVAFFSGEFESLFLHCLDQIALKFPDYGWQLGDWEAGQAHEGVVGAKAALSRRMKRGRSYKEVRDQVKFVEALDFNRLRGASRSFRHFEAMLLWAVGKSDAAVYPLVGRE